MNGKNEKEINRRKQMMMIVMMILKAFYQIEMIIKIIEQ